jgi:hypothetical protein
LEGDYLIMSKTTTFENELRKIFDGIESLTNKKYIGRAFYGNIDKDIRLKAEIISLNTYEHYEAIRIKSIKRDEGEIDVAVIRFKDVLGTKPVSNRNFPNGVSPHMWINSGMLEWYVYVPNEFDYEKIIRQIEDYIEVFQY